MFTYNSNFFVTFVSQSGLTNAGYDVSSWPLYVSNIYNKPEKLKCNACGNLSSVTDKPVTQSFHNSKFVLIEFSPEIMRYISTCIYANIQVRNTPYSLKGLVRSFQSHFTCHIENKWVYFDD